MLQAAGSLEAEVVSQYVWGARTGHRDELILRDRIAESRSSDTALNERLWSLMDYYDPTSVVDTEGAVVERYRFSAFGLRTVLAPDFIPRAVSDYEWDFGFKGQFLDLDTGYYNYGYRYYSPELGRWLSRDPIGERGGINLYAIASNTPNNRLDYLGLIDDLCCVKSLQVRFVRHLLGFDNNSSSSQFVRHIQHVFVIKAELELSGTKKPLINGKFVAARLGRVLKLVPEG
jgi:RHS repeat-associated protein